MTLRQQAETFMQVIAERKRKPVRLSTRVVYQSSLDNWILPMIGDTDLASVGNKTMKEFVAAIQAELAPATVRLIVNLVKDIVKSAVDENGDQLYPRVWNMDFIDAPEVLADKQHAPILSKESLCKATTATIGQTKALCLMLLSSGVRIGELQALRAIPRNEQDSYWDRTTSTLHIKSTFVREQFQACTKTDSGYRVVDLHPEANEALQSMLPKEGWLFLGKNDKPITQMTIGRHLKQAGINEGAHAFRRFRITRLEMQGVPDGIAKLWAGHAGEDITDRYVKVESMIEERKSWAQKAGLGFQL